MRLADAPDEFVSEGRYRATAAEIARRAGTTEAAVRVAVGRWKRSGRVFSPARGLYVFITPEFRKWGSLPAEWFIDAAMSHLGRRYYAGLLTAAARHGAAHQAPQTFQVMIDRQLAALELGRVRVVYFVSARIGEVPVETVNTPTGTMRISSPETTALDLVDRAGDAGGLGHVATALAELAERLDSKRLAGTARLYPRAVAARLGHLLEHVAPAFPLERLEKVVGVVNASVALDVRRPRRGPRDARWGLIVNAPIESEA